MELGVQTETCSSKTGDWRKNIKLPFSVSDSSQLKYGWEMKGHKQDIN